MAGVVSVQGKGGSSRTARAQAIQRQRAALAAITGLRIGAPPEWLWDKARQLPYEGVAQGLTSDLSAAAIPAVSGMIAAAQELIQSDPVRARVLAATALSALKQVTEGEREPGTPAAVLADAAMAVARLVQLEQRIFSPDQLLYGDDGSYRHSQDRVVAAWSGTLAAYREMLGTGDIRRVDVLVGIPGAGKSYWIAHNQQPDVAYVDSVAAQPQYRPGLTAPANEADIPVRAVVIRIPLDVALERNALRDDSQGAENSRRVPERLVREWHAFLESQPPSAAEGFGEIVYVDGSGP